MRTIKVSTASLLCLIAALAFADHSSATFTASGQATTLSAPTNVTASDNAYATKVEIEWEAIRGATLYRVFRNTSNDSASAIALATTTQGSFFEPTAIVGQTYFYWVRAENGSNVSTLSAPDQGTRAVGVINGPVGPLNPPPVPPGNPITAAKAYLGKTLFWDEQLSSTRTVACGTCHFAASGGSDSRAIIGSARSTNPGADGLFGTADDVFASPGVISNNSDGTYNLSPVYGFREQVPGRSYPELFEEAFGTPEVTPVRIALAIATFERTLYSDRTPFDQSVAQITPLAAAEIRGQGVFNQSRCNVCHAGTLFSDNQFHNIGVRPQFEDTGRFQVTGNPNNIGEFRTPNLRNVGLRGPYFHDGHFATLEEVVDFYNRGGDFNAPNIDHNLIRPLNLSPQQKSDLVAFLRGALTDPRVAAGSAPFDRPLLYSESARVPQIIGSGSAGTGNNVPQVVAIEPPVVANPNFTVGVWNALGGADAVLVIDNRDPGVGAAPASASFNRSVIRLSGSGAGQGFGSVSIQIANSASLVGQTFYGRWYVSDPNAAGGVAVSPAFRFTIFNESISGAVAIDDPSIFIHQQYLDFLNRQPEPGPDGVYGTTDDPVNFYLNILNGCGSDFECTKYTRGALSAIFFRSPEFQRKGSYVANLTNITIGQREKTATELSDPTKVDRPHYSEFISALASISTANDDTATTETLKDQLANAWLQRSEIQQKLPSSLTNQQFVQTLESTAGVTLANENTLIANLNNGSQTRPQVLRAVAESVDVSSKFYKPNFVMMEYFGYLRRDPEDCHNPANWSGGDANQCGYIFHNNRFNLSANADLIENIIVRGFIESAEYRARF